MLNRLPGVYRKDSESNIYKLIKLAADQMAAGENTLELIRSWRDINEAEGETLNKIGKDVGQSREGLNDDNFRKKIKIKIRANLSGGEIETLNSICLVLLDDRFDGIQEGWTLSNEHPIGAMPAMMLFTVKADGVNFGIPMAEIDEISAGGVAANWELLIEGVLDLTQTDYKYWLQRYTMSNEARATTEQQSGFFYYPQMEASTQYIEGLHNPLYCGTSKAGEGGLIL